MLAGRRLVRVAMFGGLILCVGAAALSIAHLVDGTSGIVSGEQFRWQYLMLATASMLGLVGVYALSWLALLNALGERPRALSAFRAFLVSWPGRYAPASAPYYAGRLALAPGIGVTRAGVAASLVYENLFVIASSGSIGVAVTAWESRGAAGGAWVVAAAAASLLSIAALHPVVVRFTVRVASTRVTRLAALQGHVVSGWHCTSLFLLYGAAAGFAGMALHFSLLAIDPSQHLPILLAIGAYNLAGVAGMLAIAVPSGVGVREAVTVGLVGSIVSPPVALAAVIVARLAGVFADFLPFALILVVSGATRLKRAAVRLYA